VLKKEIRSLYKQKRVTLKHKETVKFNDLLLIELQQTELPFLHNVLSYYPLEELNEPDTFLITRYLKFTNPQLQIAYPRIKEDGTMMAVITNVDSEYEENKYGISELTTGAILHPKDIDLIIVPMLACNYKGHRVGYGKGYYDKYMQHCRPDVLKIGLSFFDPIDKINDLDIYDIPLTHCITPELVYEF
jgi:5-formyltetrahydrofolate cyclo-ligase